MTFGGGSETSKRIRIIFTPFSCSVRCLDICWNDQPVDLCSGGSQKPFDAFFKTNGQYSLKFPPWDERRSWPRFISCRGRHIRFLTLLMGSPNDIRKRTQKRFPFSNHVLRFMLLPNYGLSETERCTLVTQFEGMGEAAPLG